MSPTRPLETISAPTEWSPADSGDDEPGRRRVLDAAATLFVRQGFAATSMRDIATSAGMKAGSVYHHFPSKEALLVEILEQGIAVMVDAFDQVADTASDFHQRVRAHIRAHLSALFEHGPYTRAHVTTFRYVPPGVQDTVVVARDHYEQRWAGLLAEGSARGDIRDDLDIGLVRLLVLGAMNSTVEWFDPQRGNLNELTDATIQLVWFGLAGASPGTSPHTVAHGAN